MVATNSLFLVKSPESEKAGKIILGFLSKYSTLSKEEEVAITDCIKVQRFKKGTYLVKEGEIPWDCYFTIEGCVRQFYLKDGEEKTTAFKSPRSNKVGSCILRICSPRIISISLGLLLPS